MNRYDEIQSAARDIADWVCADPADRNRMANELIRLVSLVVKATGKGVAVAGEEGMHNPDDDTSFVRFRVGEAFQRAAGEVRKEATDADIVRYVDVPYEQNGLAAVWRPDPAKRRPASATGSFAPGELTRLTHETADAMREQHKTPVRCGECNRVLKFGHVFGCSRRIPAGATKDVLVPFVSHTWVLATNADGTPLNYIHCGVCGVRRCDRSCGDPSVDATPDIDCTTHGNDQARQCVERCRGCGDPVDNGRVHGPNQGFGGCC